MQPFLAKNQGMKWTHKESLLIVYVSLWIMVVISALFGTLAVSAGFFFWNFLVVVLFLLCFHWFRNLTLFSTQRYFQYVVFFVGLGIRLCVMIVLYVVFYDITGTSFDVEAIDALSYHDMGLKVARQIGEGKLDLYVLSRGGRVAFDDMGYGLFLGLMYFIFDKSIIMARIFQCVLDSFSVIFLYKITGAVWDEKTARFAAILSMLFPMQILYTALHLKETFMIFCLLLGTLAVYRLSERIRPGRLSLLIGSLIGLASMRTALLIVFIAGILIFYTFRKAKSLIYKALLIALVFSSLVASLTYLGVEQGPYRKTMNVVGLDKDVRFGGRTLEQVAKRGQSAAGAVSLPLLAVQAFLSPYPSMVRTNIVYFNQTMQWYQIGALFVWGFLAFFAVYGLYYSIRFHLNETLFLSTLLIGYTTALVISVYIMSIRYNIIKLVLFLPFIAVGMEKFPKSRLHVWYLYCGFFAIIVLAWNYIKLHGRGYV